MKNQLTNAGLTEMARWAAEDLSRQEGNDVQLVVDELRSLRKRVAELELACRCGASALRIHHENSPTAVELDAAAMGRPSVYRSTDNEDVTP